MVAGGGDSRKGDFPRPSMPNPPESRSLGGQTSSVLLRRTARSPFVHRRVHGYHKRRARGPAHFVRRQCACNLLNLKILPAVMTSSSTKKSTAPEASFRIEHDSMGEVRVPAQAY